MASESDSRLADLDSDVIDHATFDQILQMDDDEDDRDFSKSIVFDFFEQAQGTFEKMANALEKRDLPELSQLGHFLKGSSATLGMTKVKDSCEKIQHFGARKDAEGNDQHDDEKSLKDIGKTIKQAEAEFQDAEQQLRRFYNDTD